MMPQDASWMDAMPALAAPQGVATPGSAAPAPQPHWDQSQGVGFLPDGSATRDPVVWARWMKDYQPDSAASTGTVGTGTAATGAALLQTNAGGAQALGGNIPQAGPTPQIAVHPDQPAPASGGSWMDGMPTLQPTPEMQAARAKPAAGAPQQPLLQRVGTDIASAIEGIPRGVLGDKVIDYGNAAIGTLPGMIYGQPAGQAQPQLPMNGAAPPPTGFRVMGPGDAFNQALAISRADHADAVNAAPISNTAGQVAGALGTGIAAAPALVYKAPAMAATMLPRIAGTAGAVASYLGRNAAFGAGTNYLAGGDPTTGGVVGGGLAAALPVVGKAVGLGARAVSKMMPLASRAAQETSVANRLARVVSPAQIESSPVGPLSLPQATNNPEVAALADLAPGYNATANDALKSAQGQAVESQVGKIGKPSTMADASSAFVNTARDARGVAGKEESRLWTVPELAQTKISQEPVQQSVKGAVDGMEPVFREAMSPQLKGLLAELEKAGPTTVRDLNGIRSRLERIARNSLDGAERSQARTMSDAFINGMDEVPELQNDPAIKAAYEGARDFTKRMRTMFADPQLANVLRKAQGVYARDPSEGARLFFNFSNGSPEGPRSIAELSDFLAGLHAQPGAAGIAADLKDSARAYIAASLAKAAKIDGGSGFNPKAMQQFLTTNMKWIETSGLFDKVQIEAAQDLLKYAEMLRRPEALLQQVNSATQFRQERSKNFIDTIMSPWVRRIAELTATGGAAHMHGALGAGIGLMASQGFEHAVAGAESSMRSLMAGALLNSRTARDVLMKVNKNGGFLSPQTRQLMESIRLSIGSDVIPHMLGASKAPLAVGQ